MRDAYRCQTKDVQLHRLFFHQPAKPRSDSIHPSELGYEREALIDAIHDPLRGLHAGIEKRVRGGGQKALGTPLSSVDCVERPGTTDVGLCSQ